MPISWELGTSQKALLKLFWDERKILLGRYLLHIERCIVGIRSHVMASRVQDLGCIRGSEAVESRFTSWPKQL